MKKFLLPIINLVNIVLVSIVFGLGSNPAYSTIKTSSKGAGESWYSLVWMPISGGKVNVLGIVSFFLLCFAAAGILFSFIPVKARKFVIAVTGAMLIAAGVMFLLAPTTGGMRNAITEVENSDSLVGMAVLAFVSGACSLAMAVIDFIPSKKAK